MRGMEAEFRHVLERLDINQALTTPLASTVSGEIIPVGGSMDVEHWVKQLASPVLFELAFTGAMMYKEQRCSILVELGPKPVLTKMTQAWWKPDEAQVGQALWVVSLDQGSFENFNETLDAVDEVLCRKPQDTLSDIFPNRSRLPWPDAPPHPLLQWCSSVSNMTEYHTIFHDKLMEMYSSHEIGGRMIFPGAGYIEMGLAAGLRMPRNGRSHVGVELLDVRFLQPLDLEVGCKLTCNHHLGGGMDFFSASSEEQSAVVASIGQVNGHDTGSSVIDLKSLIDLKKSHTLEVANIRSRYARLAEAGHHRGAFQSIHSVLLNKKDKRSVLGQLGLPEGIEHEHNAYYRVHPAVVDGAFQLIGLMSELLEGESWVPAGISRVVMYRQGSLHLRRVVWAHSALVEDGSKMKTCNIDMWDDHGPILSFEGLRYARLGLSGPNASMYTANWIPSSHNTYIADSEDISTNITIINISGYQPFNFMLDENMAISTMTLAELQLLNASKIPTKFIVPLLTLSGSSVFISSSSAVIEECLLMLQILVSTLLGATNGKPRQLCFWTSNAEGPWVGDSDVRSSTDSDCDRLSLIGSSIWGMIRSASLEIDASVLRLVCIDTELCSEREGLTHVVHELGTIDNTMNIEGEVSYRGNERFVRRLQRSKQHLIGDVELTFGKRGSLDNLSVSPLRSDSTSIPDGCVEVAVHSVGLNFKDVLNVLVPDESAYIGFDSPPLPGSDFAGTVMATPSSSTDPSFVVGDRVYGLGFGMLRSKKIVSVDSIAKIPSCLSFEEASALPTVFLTVIYALREQAGLKCRDRILIHSTAGGVSLVAVQYA